MILSSALERHGYQCITARDGEAGIRRAALAQPDMILLDVHMPAMDGFETCRRLKAAAATREIPVLFMTTPNDPSGKVAGFEAGGIGYLTKPVEELELLVRVKNQMTLVQLQHALADKNVELEREIAERVQAEQAHLHLAAVEERQRLARNLHDSVTQSLHSLVLLTETSAYILAQGQFEALSRTMGQLQTSARQALKEMRLMLYELQPRPWNTGAPDLAAALEKRLDSVERRTGIEALLNVNSVLICPPEWSFELFWIATEALNNALKYAQATQISITLHHDDSLLVMEVRDNGRGFVPNLSQPGRMGLRSMTERAAGIGAELQIDSTPGKGACVRCVLNKAKHKT